METIRALEVTYAHPDRLARVLWMHAIGDLLGSCSSAELNVGESVKTLDLDEPAELSFSEKKGKIVLSLTDIIRFEHLSTALIFAVRTMHDSHRPNCTITTQSGNIYRWSDIPALYDAAKFAG